MQISGKKLLNFYRIYLATVSPCPHHYTINTNWQWGIMDEISYWCCRHNDITKIHELIAAGHNWALVPCIKEKCDRWRDCPAYCVQLERIGKYGRVH